MKLGWFVLAVMAWTVGCPTVGWPAQSAAILNDQGEVRLLSSLNRIGDQDRVELGLLFRLKPGWKIYWRSPGDAGYPPTIDWKGSDNLADTVISWPVPRRFEMSGVETIGYKDEVVLPIMARLTEPGKALSLRAAVDYLVCDVTCVPAHADLSLNVPAGSTEASPEAHLIDRFAVNVPKGDGSQGLSLTHVEATRDGALSVIVAAATPLLHPDLFVERADQMQFSPPKVTLEQGGRRAVFHLQMVPDTGEDDIFAKPLTLTVADGTRGMEAVADVIEASSESPWFLMVGLALTGGLILNLMPCVLPVLSIKLLSFIGHGGAEQRTIREGFLASAAGIWLSFLGLAIVVIVAREAGTAVGWGIQFQQPLFLVILALIVTLFAANLWDWFDVPMPQWIADLGNVGSSSQGRLAGDFFSGIFATLLATPCSAPFLGTSIGFALSRGPLEILSIFSALGVGMAFPYLLVALCPQLVQWLPRPGRWMLIVRRLLGVALIGTMIWMLNILMNELGPIPALIIGGLFIAILVLLFFRQCLPNGWWKGGLAGLIVIILAVEAQPWITPVREDYKGLWVPFDREVIARTVAGGGWYSLMSLPIGALPVKSIKQWLCPAAPWQNV